MIRAAPLLALPMLACVEIGEVRLVADSIPTSNAFVAVAIGSEKGGETLSALYPIDEGHADLIRPTDGGEVVELWVWPAETISPLLPSQESDWVRVPLSDAEGVLLPMPDQALTGRIEGDTVELTPRDKPFANPALTAPWLPECTALVDAAHTLAQTSCVKTYCPIELRARTETCGFRMVLDSTCQLDGDLTARPTATGGLEIDAPESAGPCSEVSAPDWASLKLECETCDFILASTDQAPQLEAQYRERVLESPLDPLPAQLDLEENDGYLGVPAVLSGKLYVPTYGGAFSNTNCKEQDPGSIVILSTDDLTKLDERPAPPCLTHLLTDRQSQVLIGLGREGGSIHVYRFDAEANVLSSAALELNVTEPRVPAFELSEHGLFLIARYLAGPREVAERLVWIDPNNFDILDSTPLIASRVKRMRFAEDRLVLLEDAGDKLIFFGLDLSASRLILDYQVPSIEFQQEFTSDFIQHPRSRNFLIAQASGELPAIVRILPDRGGIDRVFGVFERYTYPLRFSLWPADPDVVLMTSVPRNAPEGMSVSLVDPVEGYVRPGMVHIPEVESTRRPLPPVVDPDTGNVYVVIQADNDLVRISPVPSP